MGYVDEMEKGEIIKANLGYDFKLLKDKEAFKKIYGPGCIIPFTKGETVTLTNVNYAEKTGKNMILIANTSGSSLWVTPDFIDLDLTINDTE